MIKLTLYFRKQLMEWSKGRSIISTIVNASDQLIPDEVSNLYSFDPKASARLEDVTSCKNYWCYMADHIISEPGKGEIYRFKAPVGFHLRRKKQLQLSITVNHAYTHEDGRRFAGSFSLASSNSKKVDWVKLFHDLIRIIQPHAGYLSYAATGCFYAPMRGSDDTIITALGWHMAFGDEFRDAVPEAALKKAGFAVRRRGGVVTLRLTDDLFDEKTRPEYVQERREIAKALFPEGFFQQCAEI